MMVGRARLLASQAPGRATVTFSAAATAVARGGRRLRRHFDLSGRSGRKAGGCSVWKRDWLGGIRQPPLNELIHRRFYLNMSLRRSVGFGFQCLTCKPFSNMIHGGRSEGCCRSRCCVGTNLPAGRETGGLHEHAHLGPAIILPLDQTVISRPFRQIRPATTRTRHPQQASRESRLFVRGPRLSRVPPGTKSLIRSH